MGLNPFNMTRLLLCCFLHLVFAPTVFAQMEDDFSDSNFTANPAWQAGPDDWKVNDSLRLQSNNQSANSQFSISTLSALAVDAEWSFSFRLSFNPSSQNYTDVYLVSSEPEPAGTSNRGYFVRIGGADDDICLYRKDPGLAAVKVIDGRNGILNRSLNEGEIIVSRDSSYYWRLSHRLKNAPLVRAGSVTDSTWKQSHYFAVLVRQSTASFFGRHEYDGFRIGQYHPDTSAPNLVSLATLSATELQLVFDEVLDSLSVTGQDQYQLSLGGRFPDAVVYDPQEPEKVRLVFSVGFPERVSLGLSFQGIRDLDGNSLQPQSASFLYYVPRSFDLLITEIMADPTPVAGLPAAEWIELTNRSGVKADVGGFYLAMNGTPVCFFTKREVLPDSSLVLCSASAAADLSVFGQALGLSGFPSLPNEGALISLHSPKGEVIHAVRYSDSWYSNELKKEGGWTLEMIDPGSACLGASNWKASNDPAGGTPGRVNSINGFTPDNAPPRLLRAFVTDSTHITLRFDESVDSVRAALASSYLIDGGIGQPLQARAVAPLFEEVMLLLDKPLLPGVIYRVSAGNQSDCNGNNSGDGNSVKLGLPAVADSLDLVINEILFNPVPGGVDYIEVFNRSNKVIDLGFIYLANMNESGTPDNIVAMSPEKQLLFPGEYAVATVSKEALMNKQLVPNPEAVVEPGDMPSMNDDEGVLLLMNGAGLVIDRLHYYDDWHHALLNNTEGVSLERMDALRSTDDAENWTSASEESGFGTPTYKNSQGVVAGTFDGEIVLDPPLFSPDGDGQDDFAFIRYRLPGSGYVGRVIIFDAAGRQVRRLKQGSLAAVEGSYRWEGMNEKGELLLPGMYVVYAEFVHPTGKVRKFRKTILLARRR